MKAIICCYLIKNTTTETKKPLNLFQLNGFYYFQ